MTLLMKPKGIYLSGWLGQSGVAWELVLDERKVSHVWIWESSAPDECPDKISAAIEDTERSGEADPVIIRLSEYFFGDMFQDLLSRLLQRGGSSSQPFNRDDYRYYLKTLREGVGGLMHDGVIIRLQLRHDLKRHCGEGGACFYDEVKHRWVCLE